MAKWNEGREERGLTVDIWHD